MKRPTPFSAVKAVKAAARALIGPVPPARRLNDKRRLRKDQVLGRELRDGDL